MGYRLDVYNESKTINYYGTKHYGYSFTTMEDGIEYPSYRYLLRLKKITGEEYFDDGYCPKIFLTAKQFEHFIKLYAKEWEQIKGRYPDWKGRLLLTEPKIIELLKSDERKIISWC